MVSAPSESTAMNGALQSPINPHHSLFVMEGSRTLVTNANTNRIEVILDAEATLRNGQAKAYAFEYSATDAILAMTDIDISAGSGNFSCGGVVATRLDVSNSSSVNEVSGHMTGAVLNTVPANVSQLTATRLKQKTPAKHDQASCQMKEDGVTLLSITSHLGAKATSLEADKYTNTSNWFKEYDIASSGITGFDTLGNTVTAATGQINTFITGETAKSANNSGQMDRVWDSDRLATSPFTQATFGLELSFDGELIVKTAPSGTLLHRVQIGVAVLDHAGNIMEEKIFTATPVVDYGGQVPGEADTMAFAVNHLYEFTRQPRPIARAFMWVAESSILNITLPANSSNTTGRHLVQLRGLENLADLPDRDLNIVVAEGVNSGAAITIECGIVVSGIPAADRTFIAGGAVDTFVDDSLIQNYLRTALKGVPRANLQSEVGDLRETVKHIMSQQDHSEAFHAWSFGSIGRAFRSVANTVRSGVRGFDKVLTRAIPVARTVGGVVSGMGGVPYVGKYMTTAGQMLERGADFGDKVHKYTQHADSHGGVHDTRTGRMVKHGAKMYAMNTY